MHYDLRLEIDTAVTKDPSLKVEETRLAVRTIPQIRE
jgi:hypothetical protein